MVRNSARPDLWEGVCRVLCHAVHADQKPKRRNLKCETQETGRGRRRKCRWRRKEVEEKGEKRVWTKLVLRHPDQRHELPGW